jgi:hypothetical protein
VHLQADTIHTQLPIDKDVLYGQILPMSEGCRRQIDIATTWCLWRGANFRVPLSTIQWKKFQGGWKLTNVSAKSRVLLYYCLTMQGWAPETLTANWLWKLDLLSPGENPPYIARIPQYLGYLRQYALDNAYIHQQERVETNMAYKRRMYSTVAHLLSVTVAHRLMRIERLWSNTDWPVVCRYIKATSRQESLKAQWYKVIHNLIPTNERLHKIHLSPTDQCWLYNQTDT